MLRRAWKPVLGTTVLVGAPSYIYYRYSTRPHTFEFPVRERGPDGKAVMKNRSTPLLSKEEHATAYLAANNPIEDANTSTIIERDPSDLAGPGDLFLIPAVTLELSALSWFFPQSVASAKSDASAPSDADPAAVSVAIQRAFSSLDAELINAPLRILADHLSKSTTDGKTPPDLSKHPLALPSMQPAIQVRRSCALMAMFDTAHRNLYVACTGDSLCYGQGTWRVEVLSEDQTGRNPNELKRMQSEHPPEEAADVIRNGGRAFGDARYKWPEERLTVVHSLAKVFLEGNGMSMRMALPTLKTPPYVTSRPEVTHRKLALPSDPSASQSKSALRFLVLATDGLWDQLTSEEVVALVAGHLAGLKGAVAKTSLPGLVRTSSGAPTVEGKDKRRKGSDGAWAFVDENVGAHLIRNAFGGADERRLRELLSIPAPHARRYRDDITVTVVWWEDGKETDAQTTTLIQEQTAKAKL
ncbi:protein serine/threonine phosphatase 2C [Amylocystis lapponica]|nr:protein serine/threonine phosphatase 2C [Amylocystis lapponica]